MKYRSLKWWIVALWYYLSIPASKLLYKIFFYPQSKIEIASSIQDDKLNREKYYYILTNKYPEFLWCEKYLDEDSFVVPDEIRIVGTAVRNNCSSIWTHEANIEHLNKLIKIGPIQTTIYIKNKKVMHSVVIVGINEDRHKIIIHDPLGDYNSNYKIWYGANVEIDIDEYIKISTGKIFTFIIYVRTDNEKNIIVNTLNDINYYIIP